QYPEDVQPDVPALTEINPGSYVFNARDLLDALDKVPEQRGERYLTAVVPILIEAGMRVVPHHTDDVLSAHGVNTRADLMRIEELARARLLERHALNGVTFTAPQTVVVDADVEIGEDT